MSKVKTVYNCSQCGEGTPKWQGKCPNCGAWNSLQEEIVEKQRSAVNKRFDAIAATAPVRLLNTIQAQDVSRIATGSAEFDRVLGGGLVSGAVVLIGGEPGIGKSTLLLQLLDNLQRQEINTFYLSGEESGNQIAMRAARLGIQDSQVALQAEIQLEKIIAQLMKQQPQVAVIDSIQTIYSDQLSSAPGSVVQVRECATQLTRLAKAHNITIILVGHVTKDGNLAGPRVLEHIVDTVLYFDGDNNSSFRLIRAFKNRFGAVNEIGVFAMTDKGIRGVNNPSAIFLSSHQQAVAGTCVLVTLEGSRPLLVEIQALVDSSAINPRRLSVGLEKDRLAMLLAVLHRHGGVNCANQDVFINAVGGVKINEPAADLAVMLAIYSSLHNQVLPAKLAVFGEVGLAGEIRAAPRGQERLKEAVKLGFETAIIPAANMPKKKLPGLKLYPVTRVEAAIELVSSWRS